MPTASATPAKRMPDRRRNSRAHRWLIRRQDREYFVEYLGIQLHSGMDMSKAIEGIERDIRSKPMRRLINHLRSDINAGLPLSQALDRTGIMPSYVISLVRIGEESGRLPQNLEVIVRQQAKQREFRSRILVATAYPLFIFAVTIIMGVSISWFILPRLATVFADLNVELPLITKILIRFGQFLGVYGVYVIPAFVVVLLLLFYLLFISRYTKWFGQSILLHIPGIKILLQQIELSRMGYIVGSLLGAGLPIIDALDALVSSTSLRPYNKLYARIRADVQNGLSIEQSFADQKRSHVLVPYVVQQIISVAEQSGRLADSLSSVGATFEEKTETTTKSVSVVIEPVLLVIVWFGVVLVALAVVLPVYSLVGSITV